MPKHRLISPDQFLEVAWKNGQGKTLEILQEGLSGQEGFYWRLSMATVSVDGYFSDFSGYDRTLVLLDGSGIRLEHNSEKTDYLENSLEMAHFSGGDRTWATLTDGTITDFNIMTYSAACSADTAKVSGRLSDADVSSCSCFLLYAHLQPATVSFTDSAEKKIIVPADSLLHIEQSGELLRDLAIEAESAIYIKITPRETG